MTSHNQKSDIMKKIHILLAVICMPLWSMDRFDAQPVKEENPFIQLEATDGTSIWFDINDARGLKNVAALVKAKNECKQKFQTGTSGQANRFFCDVAAFKSAFVLINGSDFENSHYAQLDPDKLAPYFVPKIPPMSHFYDFPYCERGFHAYKIMEKHIGKPLSAQQLIDLVTVANTHLDFALKDVALWAIAKNKGWKTVEQERLIDELGDSKERLGVLDRYQEPPKHSVFDELFVHEPPKSYQPNFRYSTNDMVTWKSQFSSIKSLFGFGAFLKYLRKISHIKGVKDVAVEADLFLDHGNPIDDIDVHEMQPFEPLLVRLYLDISKTKVLARNFFTNATHLKDVYIIGLDFGTISQNSFLKASTALETISLKMNRDLNKLSGDFLAATTQLKQCSIILERATIAADFLKNARNLEELNLESREGDCHIEYGFLSGEYPNLTAVSFEGCGLQQLPPTILQNAPQLIYCNVWSNNLTELPPSLLNLTNLQALRLQDNPLWENTEYLRSLPDHIQKLIEQEIIEYGFDSMDMSSSSQSDEGDEHEMDLEENNQ